MSEDGSVARYRTNLQGEIDSAALYRAMPEAEADPHLSEVYRRLAAVEEAHAEFWRKQLGGLGATGIARQPGWRTRALVWLARRFGPQFVLPTLSTLEQRDSGQYDRQPEAVAGGLPAAERSHNRVVEAMAVAMPGGASGSSLARFEGRHRSGQKLTNDAGKIMQANGGGRAKITDGPFAESKDVIGGFWVISAKDYDEACRVAETSPHLGYGGRIEVRQIDEMYTT